MIQSISRILKEQRGRVIKDYRGHVRCPVLAKYCCPHYNNRGNDRAHVANSCLKKREDALNSFRKELNENRCNIHNGIIFSARSFVTRNEEKKSKQRLIPRPSFMSINRDSCRDVMIQSNRFVSARLASDRLHPYLRIGEDKNMSLPLPSSLGCYGNCSLSAFFGAAFNSCYELPLAEQMIQT